jgi:hypothetical protein
MLAKKTTKNQITLPKKVVENFSGVEYFEVSTDGTCIILCKEAAPQRYAPSWQPSELTNRNPRSVSHSAAWLTGNPSSRLLVNNLGTLDAAQSLVPRMNPMNQALLVCNPQQ